VKVLITGSQGFLGSRFLAFREYYENLGIDFVECRLKFNNHKEVSDYDFKEYDAVINCAALTNIDECEINPEKAFWVNSELPREITKLIRKTKTKFIHISTDAVFDGSSQFSKETDTPNPISVYGESKLKGEIAVLEADESNLVCRVNFVGSNPRGNSLFDFFYSKMVNNEQVQGFTNIFFTPLYIDDVVHGVASLLQLNENGIFHLVGSERISKFEFGKMIEDTFFKDLNYVDPVSFVQKPGQAQRGLDLSLSNSKAISLGLEVPALGTKLIQLMPKLKKG
jgi:dTDP-4-dehydrorhamnose reductase